MNLYKYIFQSSILVFFAGCQMVDWHCTKGGQWSPWYTLGDSRCTYFCADREEKYCGKSPADAEAKMAQNPVIQQEQKSQNEANMALDTAICKKLGFKPDTDSMAHCMLTQYQNRFGLAIKDKEMELQGAKESADNWDSAMKSSAKAFSPKLTCTTNLGVTQCW